MHGESKVLEEGHRSPHRRAGAGRKEVEKRISHATRGKESYIE